MKAILIILISLISLGWSSVSKEGVVNKKTKLEIRTNTKNLETYTDGSTGELPTPIHFSNLKSIKDNLFKKTDNEYLILTINLHTYQETLQEEKFDKLVDLIGKMDIDFIALQEAAQNKDALISHGIIREDNMAKIISDKLKDKYSVNYNYIWHWAHYGWNIWEEGISILSKHPLIDSEDRYVSTSKSIYEISSRKAIYGLYNTPHGKVNMLSTHTFWRGSKTDQEQNTQIRNIKNMITEKEQENPVSASIVCGDFNSNPTDYAPWNEGYLAMVENGQYIDSFLKVYSDANDKPAQKKYNTIEGSHPGRIDYIFMKKNSNFEIIDSQIVFTDDVIGKISDHYGVIVKIRSTTNTVPSFSL